MLNNIGETYSHSGMMDYPRIRFTEWESWNFLDSLEFRSSEVDFRTEACLRAADPQVTLLWIKEVEIAKSIDELVTSRSITGQPNLLDFDMIDAMIASALKKLLNTQSHYRKTVSVEEQRVQKSDRFSRGRQVAYMIYEYFRAAGAYEAVQGLADSFTRSLQNDDVQDFDVRWDHTLETVSAMPSDAILEGLYKSKLHNSVQLQTVMPCMIKMLLETMEHRTITILKLQ